MPHDAFGVNQQETRTVSKLVGTDASIMQNAVSCERRTRLYTYLRMKLIIGPTVIYFHQNLFAATRGKYFVTGCYSLRPCCLVQLDSRIFIRGHEKNSLVLLLSIF